MEPLNIDNMGLDSLVNQLRDFFQNNPDVFNINAAAVNSASYLNSSELGLILLPVKIIFGIISLIIIGGIVYIIIKTTWFKQIFFQDAVEFFTYKPYGVGAVAKSWKKISARLETNLESEYKLAIIEADSLLDETLNRMGYNGQNLLERLDKLTLASLPNMEKIKQANKIRNNIVYDPDYRLTPEQTKQTLEIYEQAFTDLQAF